MTCCPTCKYELEKATLPAGLVYSCPECGGKNISISVLKKLACDQQFLNQAWQQSTITSTGRPCPHCSNPMKSTTIRTGTVSLELDICHPCQQIWFDDEEFQNFPKDPNQRPVKSKEELPPEAKLAIAKMEMKKAEASINSSLSSCEEVPEASWQTLPGLLGLPAEINAPSLARTPILTWGLAAILVLSFILQHLYGLHHSVHTLGLIPDAWQRDYGLTLVSSFFLHAGLLHLISNVYFLLVFGDNVESHLGPIKYLCLIIISTLIAGISHVIFDPRSTTPCVGASGGICGIIAYYVILYPNAKLGMLFSNRFYHRWITFPAWSGFLVFITFQLIGAVYATNINIAFIAHLGGLVAGIGIAVLFKTLFQPAPQAASSPTA